MSEIKTTKIPRRVKCINNEHPYVVGTNDIIDDVKGEDPRCYNLNSKVLNIWDGSDWYNALGIKVSVPSYGTFANKPASTDVPVGFRYFCTDRQTTEGATDGIEIIHKGNDVWVDALGRIVS
jgi:hypothetical protein